MPYGIQQPAISAQILQLEASLADDAPLDETVAALARALHDHIRYEENEIFPRIERALTEADLQAMGQRLTRLHPKRSCEI